MHIFHTWDKVCEIRDNLENLTKRIYLFKKCQKCKKIKPLELLVITHERIIFGDKNEIHN